MTENGKMEPVQDVEAYADNNVEILSPRFNNDRRRLLKKTGGTITNSARPARYCKLTVPSLMAISCNLRESTRFVY